MAVVKAKGEPNLCRVDEIGEILLCTKADSTDVESRYFGLQGRTEKIFKAHPVDAGNHGQREEAFYTRTGLLGYVNPVRPHKLQVPIKWVLMYFICRVVAF